jgi:hypothetical protein
MPSTKVASAGLQPGAGGIAWQSSIVTAATLTAVANRGYWINTTSNACTITLPASASVGDQLVFSDFARTWGTNAVTINQNSLNFQGYSSPNPIYNTEGQSVSIVYSGATQGWIPTTDDAVTYETSQPYSVDFLVIAGGGGGGGARAGGGGAGGYRTSTQNVSGGTVYTITVGDGGALVNGYIIGISGSNSSISGSGLTTITSAGGGAGGSSGIPSTAGLSGGSGGGSVNGGTPAGSGNTPSTSPSQGNNGGTGADAPNYGAGGGGGAGAVGVNGTTSAGGNGGAGTASSITGSSVTRAGGGGGGSYNAGGAGAGGTGGGGAGATQSVNGVSGTANTGGGGGGGNETAPGPVFTNSGAGGKGVVILSVPTVSYSGISTGSPTITTSGANTILQFTGSGTYTG